MAARAAGRVHGAGNKGALCLLSLALGLIIMTVLPLEARAEKTFTVGYNGGFYLKSDEGSGMEMRLGGSFDADYRWYDETQRADDRFDIRKARLIFQGQVAKWFHYKMEYEFQGSETNNLLEAWGEFAMDDHCNLRAGQFKEPFSLEWQSPDRAQWFVERSMGYYLTPSRDVGAMVYGNFLNQGVYYAFGAFNGDGIDGSTSGSEEDSPELTARVVIKPFGSTDTPLITQAQLGFSGSTAHIDLANVNLKVKTTGMAGLNDRNVYVLSHDTKFGVLTNVESRNRLGMDGAWAYGPFALTGEYFHLTYTDLETATHPKSDAEFSDWYVSAAWCLTGENLSLAGGIVNPITPKSYYDPEAHTRGALLIGLRYDHFHGDKDWINPAAYVSTEKVDSVSACLTWYFLPMCRVLLDYTRSEFSDDIIVRTNPDGSVDYIDGENVVTLRLSIEI